MCRARISAPSPAASSGTTSTTTTGRSRSLSRSRAPSPGSRTAPGSACGRARRFAGASPRDPGRAGLRLSGGASVRLPRGPGGAGVRPRLRRRQHGALLPPCPARVSAASPREQPRRRAPRTSRPTRAATESSCRTTTADPALQDAVLRFREACGTAGIGFRAWLVGLHHEGLAARNPEAAAHGLDGSPLGHSLCPSAPEAIEYVAALAADVAARFAPETIDLEAWLYPAWEPSYTLTLALEPLDWRGPAPRHAVLLRALPPAARPAGRGARSSAPARAAGAPFAARRRRGGRRRGDHGARGCESPGRRPSRLRGVAAAVHREGVELRVFGSGDPEQARLQGLSPAAVEDADSVLVGCARLSGAELSERFTGLSELVGPRRPTVSTNWTPDRTPAAMADDVDPSRCRRRRWARPLQPLPRARGRARRVSCRGRRLPCSGGRLTMVIDAHVVIGASRDASLAVDDLLRTMDTLGIDLALISPPEGTLPVRNREGNELVARGRGGQRGSAARLRRGDAVARRGGGRGARAGPGVRCPRAQARSGAAGLRHPRRQRRSARRALPSSPAGRSTSAPARRHIRCRCRLRGWRPASPRGAS